MFQLKKGIGFPGVGALGGFEPPDLGSGRTVTALNLQAISRVQKKKKKVLFIQKDLTVLIMPQECVFSL